MKKIIVLLLSFLSLGVSNAQNIDLELTSPVPLFQDADVGDMEFGDIDNDGDNDLIITGKGGPIRTTLYRNDGNGNFSEILENVIEDVYRSKIGLNDVDDDGDLDLLISGSNSSPVLSSNLYLNDGSGNFSMVANTPFEPTEGADFEFGDIDNDGDDDVIMIGSNSSGNPIVKIYDNDGAGTFSEVNASALEAIHNGTIELFDFDDDNDLDVIMAGLNSSGNQFTGLYTNNGSGVFSLVNNTTFNNFAGGDIAIGDSDNDGDLDVLICGNLTSSDIETELYLNDGTGIFTLLPNTVFSDVSLGEASFNDFDNDGDFDVFVLGTGEGGLLNNSIVGNIYENQGANSFIVSDSLIGGYFSSHAVADIDGDDDLDLVLGGTTIEIPIRATWLFTNLLPTPLPVELISFTARLNEKEDVLLDWKTGSEINSNHFSVQRSKDGLFFEEIEKVNAQGDTWSLSNYQVEDKNPLRGLSYYRLLMVDNDETFSYSEIKTIQINGEDRIAFFPNPITNNTDFYLTGLSEGKFNLTIFDALGRLVYQETIHVEDIFTEHKIRLPELADGIYTYSIFKKSDLIKSGRLVKNDGGR
ncbi:MAG: T9SS type A sorting domain-containing protein [Saprospiraceae bacterium]